MASRTGLLLTLLKYSRELAGKSPFTSVAVKTSPFQHGLLPLPLFSTFQHGLSVERDRCGFPCTGLW